MITSATSSIASGVRSAWIDLLESERPTDVNRRLDGNDGKSGDDDKASDWSSRGDGNAADRYDGTVAVAVYDGEEEVGAFDRMKKRLSEAPVINDILQRSSELYESSGTRAKVDKVQSKISDIREDAEETWETSQNPWIYRASSVYETLTAESERAAFERRLREIDPSFNVERFRTDLSEVTLPRFMSNFLAGRIKKLRGQLGDRVYERLAAEARVRGDEGTYVDDNVLAVMNVEILGCDVDPPDGSREPTVIVHFMCQQINCVRKTGTGKIVEGSEDDIQAFSYVAAFRGEVAVNNDSDDGRGERELRWKIVDLTLNGAIAYL